MTVEIVISGGEARAIYSDEITPYVRAFKGNVERASNVEPGPNGTWYVDLSRFGWPTAIGFQTRQAALDWEVEWLKEHWLNTNQPAARVSKH
jgi:hypothetical protein